MRKLSLVAIVLVLGLLAAGIAYLVTWDIPPPAASVEKVLPDERFPR
jgi:hypothetical protein